MSGKIEWRRDNWLACMTRYFLHHDGVQTPWFISRLKHRDHPDLPYSLHGRGMDSSGCAGWFGHFRTLAEAKSKAVEFADLDARPAERCVMGNVVFLIGDRVRFREGGSSFYPQGRRGGRVVALTTGFLAYVLWDREEAPSLQYLPRLISDEQEAAA